MFDKFKKAAALIKEATVEGLEDAANATAGAYEGAKATVKGTRIVTKGVKEVYVTKDQLEDLLNTITEEITLDDSGTDDGYDTVVIRKVL